MKKKDTPQDCGMYEGDVGITYASNELGTLEPTLSHGWHVTNTANAFFHESLRKQRKIILERITNGECSVLAYHMTAAKMDVDLLSSYSGFSRKVINKHLTPKAWGKITDKTLMVYADLFDLTMDNIKVIPDTEDDV